ncbi:MAG: TetR family transcriptional regulator [Acidimicrobiales bacterium]
MVARRGRPRRLNHDEIVDGVAKMLRLDPSAPLTMARAADAVGASPMSLYRYFADKEDLVLAVIRHVMGEPLAAILPDAPWQERVRAWMSTVYDQATRHPQLFQLAASGESTAWLPLAAHLAAILEPAGFSDDRQLAEAVLWVASTTLGQVVLATAASEEMTLPRLYGAIGHLTADEASRVARLVPDLVALGDASFTLVIDMTVAALTAKLAGRVSPVGR